MFSPSSLSPSGKDFFTALFGFPETTYVETQARLLALATLTDVSNPFYAREQCDFTIPCRPDHTSNDNSTMIVSAGIFSFPTVQELRDHVQQLLVDTTKSCPTSPTTFTTTGTHLGLQNIVGEARSLHREASIGRRSPVVVQAASQFNTLEFVSPQVTPEAGITRYSLDRTQGPACAMACAAGTAYRNYLVRVPSNASSRGQRRGDQLNGLVDMENYLMESLKLASPPWKVRNGYIDSSLARLSTISHQDWKVHESELMAKLRIGVQENTVVTDDTSYQLRVTQTYNSAVSIGYSMLPANLWEPLARLVLKATYEATLLVGILQALQQQPPSSETKTTTVLLTKVGAGVFGNPDAWVIEAIEYALQQVSPYQVGLNVKIVHFGRIDPQYKALERSSS